ncbi:MAG: hypothetical protein GY711_33280 [bacterium]|nr:hypothetical protein [bacterium]
MNTNSSIPLLATTPLLLAITPFAAAQGADDCSMAQPIAGVGTYSFDNTAATTDGSPDTLCDAFGQADIENDVWFSWTAASTGFHELATCGSGVDTKVAVYAGSCTGLILGCNDDWCGVQTRVGWAARDGDTYLIRIGNFPGAAAGSGSFDISEIPIIANPTNGHTYQYVPGYGDWDRADTVATQAGGHIATIADAAEDTFVYATVDGQPTGNAWLGAFQDMNDPGYMEPGGGWVWVTGEPFTYQNWTAGEPNDGGGAEHVLGYWPAEKWNDYNGGDRAVRGFVIEYESGDVGMSYCGPAIPNSTGMAAVISATGSPLAAANNVTLTAEDLPPGQFGYFLAGQTQGFFNPPGSQGLICLTGNIGRYNQIANIIQGPMGSIALDLTAIPVNPPAAVQPGETWNFQCWFRDNNPTLTSNFTDGLTIQFL